MWQHAAYMYEKYDRENSIVVFCEVQVDSVDDILLTNLLHTAPTYFT